MKKRAKIISLVFSAMVFLWVAFSPFEISTTSAKPSATLSREDSVVTITVTAAGDAMAHMPQIQAAYNTENKTYDFNPVYQYVKPLLRTSDLNIVNFETNLAGEPYSGYPAFSAPDSFAQALLNAGFNFVIHANNHAADKGYDGLKRTLRFFENKMIPQAGIYENDSQRNASYPYVLQVKGIKIGMLNYTYGTNGLSMKSGGIINYINNEVILKDLARLKDSLCDIVLACMHWGNEYERVPNAGQIKTEHFLLENGVDVIIGSHPHVIQPVGTDTITLSGQLQKKLVCIKKYGT